jgi:hypothetical protein
MGRKNYPADPRYYIAPTPLVLTSGNRDRIIATLVSRDGPRCRYCEQLLNVFQMTIEHLTPKSRGGSNRLHNLAISCDPCNNKKGSMNDEEYRLYIKGEFITNCRYCGVDLEANQALYCGKKHGKRYNHALSLSPLFVKTLDESTPRRRQAVYEGFSATSPKPVKE